ncbi:uncharacterized protein LOC132279478 isoform X4 [Cornus florida]|uniref:uncharacterized protein LOC132279478 isoform X4 n=1 Tax=Cornus florida TaxID=4283 RepID=UPI002898BB7A|nr:uncharacterized protein LOC132279478 isoform X4 [Cornus florida]
MEEYLQYMKTLRSQMNDVEDQVAKISVEEQMQITTIEILEKDLDLAKSDIRRLKEDTDQMVKAKGLICSQILEKQRKIASMESDSSTLTQTLELIQQERVSLSTKLVEKGAYYTKVAEDMNTKLQEQQDFIQVKDKVNNQTGETEGSCMVEINLIADNLAKQSVELVKSRIHDFKPELWAMDIKTLEEEHRALLSDKAGETEFLQSVRNQIEKLMEISLVVNCACGGEYKVDLRV